MNENNKGANITTKNIRTMWWLETKGTSRSKLKAIRLISAKPPGTSPNRILKYEAPTPNENTAKAIKLAMAAITIVDPAENFMN